MKLFCRGSRYIDLETHAVELLPGQFFTIPINAKRRTRPNAERPVNLTFEHAAIKTVKLAWQAASVFCFISNNNFTSL